MNSFIENSVLKRQRQIVGIGVFFISKEVWEISMIHCLRRKNKIVIVSSQKSIEQNGNLLNILPKNVPVLLQLDGWGVLVKKKNGESSIPMNSDEFCVQESSADAKRESYYSIIRTDILNRVITFFSEQRIPIIGLSFGPFNLRYLSVFFHNETIQAGKWEITFADNEISSFVTIEPVKEKYYLIGDEKLESMMLTVFASILSFYLEPESQTTDEIIRTTKDEFIYGKLIQHVLTYSLALLFIILFANYFIWDSLNKKHLRLITEVSDSNELLTKLKDREKELIEKENLVSRYVGSGYHTFFSWYCDQLASTLPEGISLTLMGIQPVGNNIKQDSPIDYQQRIIIIEGGAGNVNEISSWVKSITNLNWVKHVELVSFSNDQDNKIGRFRLKIEY